MQRPRAAGGALGVGDLNSSLDASMLSMGGLDTTARLEARKSLSSSGLGRASFVKAAPGTAKKPAFGVGRPSIASKENVERCGTRAARTRARARAHFCSGRLTDAHTQQNKPAPNAGA